MTTGAQLSAYLAGELDADERAAVEAALEADPELRERLERLRRADETLSALPGAEPPAGFSDRLHAALDRELAERRAHPADDDRAGRRSAKLTALRPLGVAAAAAAVIALFGVAGVWLLGGGAGDQAATQAGGEAVDGAGRVPIAETDNDYDEQRLRRLAVNVDIRELVPPGLRPGEAEPLADDLQAQLRTRSELAPARGEGAPAEEAGDGDAAPQPQSRQEDTAASAFGRTAAEEVVGRCLPTALEDARNPLVPVYVELARFRGTPAVIYTLVGEDPESGTYRRVEVWAVARDDCSVLGFAQYDRR